VAQEDEKWRREMRSDRIRQAYRAAEGVMEIRAKERIR
jgi:hypothetical protein